MKSTATRTSNDIKNEILELLSIENIFNECIEELDNWNSFLDDDRYHPMDDIDFILYEIEELFNDLEEIEELEEEE